MLATLSSKRAQLHHDTQSKTQWKNSLGPIKKETYLSRLIEAVDESSTPVFKQQDSRIFLYLYQCHFEEDNIID